MPCRMFGAMIRNMCSGPMKLRRFVRDRRIRATGPDEGDRLAAAESGCGRTSYSPDASSTREIPEVWRRSASAG